MNKENCNIIKDLLPLYVDDLVSDDTRIFIEEHLSTCEECRKELSLLKSNLESTTNNITTEKDDVVLFKKFSLAIKSKRIFTGILSGVISIIVVILLYAYLTTPEYLPYSETNNILSIEEHSDIVTINLKGEYKLYQDESNTYYISLYNTLWNEPLNVNRNQTIAINPKGEKINSIYYVSNGIENDQLIYGEKQNIDEEVLTLPRLHLNYYFFITILISFILGILLILFRKKDKIKDIILKILFLPIAYIISHIIVTGLNAASYSATRDFYLILLLTIPIYFIFILLNKRINLSKAIKKEKE